MAYTFNDFMGKNMLDKPCHVYELRDNGKVVLRMNVALEEDGSENLSAKKVFMERAERIMDSHSKEEIMS